MNVLNKPVQSVSAVLSPSGGNYPSFTRRNCKAIAHGLYIQCVKQCGPIPPP